MNSLVLLILSCIWMSVLWAASQSSSKFDLAPVATKTLFLGVHQAEDPSKDAPGLHPFKDMAQIVPAVIQTLYHLPTVADWLQAHVQRAARLKKTNNLLRIAECLDLTMREMDATWRNAVDRSLDSSVCHVNSEFTTVLEAFGTGFIHHLDWLYWDAAALASHDQCFVDTAALIEPIHLLHWLIMQVPVLSFFIFRFFEWNGSSFPYQNVRISCGEEVDLLDLSDRMHPPGATPFGRIVDERVPQSTSKSPAVMFHIDRMKCTNSEPLGKVRLPLEMMIQGEQFEMQAAILKADDNKVISLNRTWRRRLPNHNIECSWRFFEADQVSLVAISLPSTTQLLAERAHLVVYMSTAYLDTHRSVFLTKEL